LKVSWASRWRARPVPGVTVIIATYNWSSVLRHSVASVLAQSYSDLELLVVGDACTDDSEEVVRSCRDPRVHWHNLERNYGSQTGPNNRGLELARGRYVAYMGHDDLWLPDHLRLLVECLERSGADLAYSLGLIVRSDGSCTISGLLMAPFGPADFVPPTTLMHRRTVVDQIGPWPAPASLEKPVDEAWQQRAREAGLRFAANDRLTAVKFPSFARRNSYVHRRDEEQARWRQRIESEPDLEARELSALLREAVAGRLRPISTGTVQRFAPAGWRWANARRLRGLDGGMQDMPSLPAELDARSFPFAIVAPPAQVVAGASFRVEATLENRTEHRLATAPPYPVHLTYSWHARGETQPSGDGRRSVLADPLPAGAVGRYVMEVIAPAQPGHYLLEPVLVQESVRRFDQPREALQQLEVEVRPGTGAGS
jgi:glycosyltransferase involved in cell wall biosynthesis